MAIFQDSLVVPVLFYIKDENANNEQDMYWFQNVDTFDTSYPVPGNGHIRGIIASNRNKFSSFAIDILKAEFDYTVDPKLDSNELTWTTVYSYTYGKNYRDIESANASNNSIFITNHNFEVGDILWVKEDNQLPAPIADGDYLQVFSVIDNNRFTVAYASNPTVQIDITDGTINGDKNRLFVYNRLNDYECLDDFDVDYLENTRLRVRFRPLSLGDVTTKVIDPTIQIFFENRLCS